MTTWDLVTILQRPFFNLLHKIIRFSDIMRQWQFLRRPKVSLNRDCTVSNLLFSLENLTTSYKLFLGFSQFQFLKWNKSSSTSHLSHSFLKRFVYVSPPWGYGFWQVKSLIHTFVIEKKLCREKEKKESMYYKILLNKRQK